MTGRPLALLLLPALLLAAGCASGGQSDQSDQIRELQERVLELQRKAAVNEVEISRLRQQVAELQGRQAGVPLSSLQTPLPSTPRRFASAPAGPAGPLSSPPARPLPPLPSAAAQPAPPPPTGVPPGTVIDETEIEVPAAPPPPPAHSLARAQARPPLPPPPAPPATSGADSAGAAVAGPAPRGEPVTPAVQALYDRGYTLYHQKHYLDAEASFQRFLQAEPQSELASNAQYWIGECRYSRGDMRGALAAFRETVSRYPQGGKAPDALLKAGMSLEALGDREGARTSYQEVLHRYPGTAVAAVAEERRAKLP